MNRGDKYGYKDRIKREQNQHIGLICCNIHELTYAMHEFNNGKYDETRTKEVIDEISTMTKEIGWPVVVMDTLEYYAGSADDEVMEMDVHEYVEKNTMIIILFIPVICIMIW